MALDWDLTAEARNCLEAAKKVLENRTTIDRLEINKDVVPNATAVSGTVSSNIVRKQNPRPPLAQRQAMEQEIQNFLLADIRKRPYTPPGSDIWGTIASNVLLIGDLQSGYDTCIGAAPSFRTKPSRTEIVP